MTSSWHGRLAIAYSYHQGKTLVSEAFHQAPFKVQRPFYPETDGTCHSVILHTAGGIVGGDRLSAQIKLGEDCRSLITTPAANRIYRSNGEIAIQDIQIGIDSDACLEYLPQEMIVFDGSKYQQNLRVELATNATFIGWEITRFGRSARGEKFVSGEWRNYTEIWQADKPLWIDRQYIPGCEEIFASPNGLFSCPVVGSLVFVGRVVPGEITTQIRLLSPSPQFSGVTNLEYGLLCRYRGDSTREVRNWFMATWQLLRQSLLGRGNCIPRVWQI